MKQSLGIKPLRLVPALQEFKCCSLPSMTRIGDNGLVCEHSHFKRLVGSGFTALHRPQLSSILYDGSE